MAVQLFTDASTARAAEGPRLLTWLGPSQWEVRTGEDFERFFSTTGIKTPETFGAVGDGVADDTAAVSSALNCGDARIYVPRVYRITAQVTVVIDVEVFGLGTIRIDADEIVGFAYSNRASIKWDSVTFDGRHRAKGAITATAVTSGEIARCIFFDFRSTSACYALAVYDFDRLRVIGCLFKRILAVGNGTAGDTAGTVRAIYGAGKHLDTIVHDCHFVDINNVTAADEIAFEDADAVQFAVNAGTPAQNVRLLDNYYANCGKRAAKFSGISTSSYEFSGSVVVSGWTSPLDDCPIGMFSVVSHYGGACKINGVTMTSGACIYLVESILEPVRMLEVYGCDFKPETHKTVAAKSIQAVLSDSSCINSTTRVVGNTFSGVGCGIYYARSLTAAGNTINMRQTGGDAIVVFGGVASISSNTVKNPSSVGVGVYVAAVDSVTASGNDIRGGRDGFYIASQASSTTGAVTSNRLVGQARYPVYNSVPAQISESGNVVA